MKFEQGRDKKTISSKIISEAFLFTKFDANKNIYMIERIYFEELKAISLKLSDS